LNFLCRAKIAAEIFEGSYEGLGYSQPSELSLSKDPNAKRRFD
jgi:hypothetical protein